MPAAYLAIAWNAADPDAVEQAEALAAKMSGEDGWPMSAETTGLRLWTVGPVRPIPFRSGFVVGDVFPAPGASAEESIFSNTARVGRDAASMARRLSWAHWGRYVAFLGGQGGPSVFRDPSGELDCLTWTLGSVQVVTSDVPRMPPWLKPRNVALNWDRIGQFLIAPAAGTSEPLLDGIDAVGPGDLKRLGRSDCAAIPVWRPAAFVCPEVTDLVEARKTLVRRVDLCTEQLLARHDQVLMELSGGLDSAIVAGSIGATGQTMRVAQWLNRAADRPEGDESGFARAVTDRLGVALTVGQKPLTALTAESFGELASTVWPAINAADQSRDLDEVDRLRWTRASAIVSGQGGDAVFFQMPSVLVASDLIRRRGWRALLSPVLPDVARRTRQSVWAVLKAVAAERRFRGVPPVAGSPFVTAQVQARSGSALHSWVADAIDRGAPPAKILQIQALANGQLLHGDSRRRRKAALLYPLLAQPVVELVLSIAASDLASGAFDRPFAREAFADRLPQAVQDRRAKGSLDSFYARMVAGSLDALRPFLLDGCLVEGGVLDRVALERALTPEQLIWAPLGSEILWAATVEAWVRHWQTRAPDSADAPRRRGLDRGFDPGT